MVNAGRATELVPVDGAWPTVFWTINARGRSVSLTHGCWCLYFYERRSASHKPGGFYGEVSSSKRTEGAAGG